MRSTRPQKLVGRHAQGRPDHLDVVETDVALTSLDPTDVGPVKACLVREAFLRPTQLCTKPPCVRREDVSESHPGTKVI